MLTALITGCSSGFGLETAKLFLDRGSHVVATMRKLDDKLLPISDRLRILPLDITDAKSVAWAVVEPGPIEVLLNNAGFGMPSPIELTEPETARHCSRPIPWERLRWSKRCIQPSASAGRA